MPFQIIRQDITKLRCDAIVNAANNTLLGGGGVDGMIHRAAGPELLEECRTLGGCETGQAKLTRGYRLSAKFVIHTVGPVWQGGGYGERELLASCYRSALALAAKANCESVAFPLISAGIFGYPKAEALQVATETIADFLTEHDMTVYLTVLGRSEFVISRARYNEVQRFLDENYEAEHAVSAPQKPSGFGSKVFRRAVRKQHALAANEAAKACPEAACAAPPSPVYQGAAVELSASLEELVGALDESFSQMLLRKIDERGMKDAECYKRANVDRKLFSKIRSDAQYRPSKPTALAFAVALELSIDETEELLRKAGYALSRSSKFDVIVEYCIRKGVYSIYEINETLFAFDQALLGTVR